MRLWLQPSSPAVGTGGQPPTAEVILSRPHTTLMNRQTLLTGVLHSLHTAECRLREAHLLYEHDLYSGAVILALFGQEELGRAVLLHGLASTLAIDASLPPGQLDALSDHVTRLGAGRCGTFLRAPARINARSKRRLPQALRMRWRQPEPHWMT